MIFAEEVNWIPRARMILEHGESRVFEPFDRFVQFERYRAPLARGGCWTSSPSGGGRAWRRWRPWTSRRERLALRGTHPDFGPVTLSQLLATWTVHDMNHMGQIVQTMAKQYRDAIGPWRRFVPIVDR